MKVDKKVSLLINQENQPSFIIIMPHHNTYGEDIITLQDAKLYKKLFTVLSHVNLILREVLSATLLVKQALERVHC